MTPVQYMIFTDMGLSTDVAVKMAFGTNLAVVLPMAISGLWRHYRKGAVKWRVSILMGTCGLLMSFGGASLAAPNQRRAQDQSLAAYHLGHPTGGYDRIAGYRGRGSRYSEFS